MRLVMVMRTLAMVGLAAGASLLSTVSNASAQGGCQGTIATGSSGVTVEGKQAARTGDTTSCGGTVVQGSSDVFINGKPAAVVGGSTDCGGTVASGSASVFINGKPMAGLGDRAGCAGK
jgi:uncharacterized Zn-binding protein involved in type VI secretion